MLSKLYKLIFDIGVSYTIGAFLMSYFGDISIYGGGFLMLIMTALVTVLLDQKRNLKIAASILLPVASLGIFRPTIPELVAFLLVWAYFFYVSITERFVISRGEFVDRIKHFLYLFLLLPFPMLTAFHKFSIAAQIACPYFIVALVSAVFLLRYLRVDNQMEQMKRYRRQQAIELVTFLVICLLLAFARVPQNLGEGLKLLYQHLVVPILAFLGGIIGMLFSGIIYLVLAIVGFLTNNQEMKKVNLNISKTVGESLKNTRIEVKSAEWVAPLVTSIGALIGLVLLFFFFRWLMGEKLKQKTPSGILETREYLEDTKGKRAIFGKRRPKDSREAVRFYYGKCLLWLQHKKVELKPQDTTEEINNKYYQLETEEFKVPKDELTQLKRIYRKARYQMTEPINEEEVEEAKKLFHTIKNAKNPK